MRLSVCTLSPWSTPSPSPPLLSPQWHGPNRVSSILYRRLSAIYLPFQVGNQKFAPEDMATEDSNCKEEQFVSFLSGPVWALDVVMWSYILCGERGGGGERGWRGRERKREEGDRGRSEDRNKTCSSPPHLPVPSLCCTQMSPN